MYAIYDRYMYIATYQSYRVAIYTQCIMNQNLSCLKVSKIINTIFIIVDSHDKFTSTFAPYNGPQDFAMRQ